MVQVVENWAVLEGRVVTTGPSDRGRQWRVVTVRPDSVQAVPGYPNLVGKQPHPLQVMCRAAEAVGLEAGDRVRARLRLAGPATVATDGHGFQSLPV